MKEGTTGIVSTMIVRTSEKYSLDLLLYIVKNLALSDEAKFQIKKTLSMSIVPKEEWKKRLWQFEYYQTNQLMNQTLDLVDMSQDWGHDVDVLSEWFIRLTLDRKETQEMLDACYFQILY